MSDINIDMMNFKQLKNEVQELRDTVTRMKRMYEDILYNLDDDNFSSRFVKEKNGMKAEIKITAEEISTKVSNETFESAMTQTAAQIATKVSGNDMQSAIDQKASEITATVSATYETKESAQTAYSSMEQTATSISTSVTNNLLSSKFTQTETGFYFDGAKAKFTGTLYFTDNDKFDRFIISHDESQSHPQLFMNGVSGQYLDIVIGNGTSDTVYIGQAVSGYEVATRSWVQANSYAKFG